MKKFLLFFSFLSGVLFAHEHGIADMRISIEKKDNLSQIFVEIDGALNNFLSFEHKPITDSEKKEWKNMNKKLSGDILNFYSDCKRNKFSTEIEMEDDDESDVEHKHEGETDIEHEHEEELHGDLEAVFEYTCKGNVTKIETKLFDIFQNLDRLEVQVQDKEQQYFKLDKNNKTIFLK
jgi:hypothetical protein